MFTQGINPTHQNEAAESIKEAHLRLVMNAKQAGREPEAVPVDPEVVGDDLARTSVEASQRTMKKAARKSFVMPVMPWKRSK